MKVKRFIIFLFFSCKARILVATGFPYENGQKTEIIDFINPDLKFEVFADTAAADRAVGGLIQNQPVICGGSYMLGMGGFLIF